MSLFDSASLCITPNGVKEGKLYSIKPTDGSGDLSVTRATTATRVNSAGLVEVVPRNILTYSEQFNNSDWVKGDMTVTANAITAPNGTLTADKIIATSNNTAHVFYQAVPTGVYSFSIYAKADEETLFSMWLNNFSKRARFDLSTGTITDSNVTNSTITDVGNGWYRCEIYDTSITSYVAIYGRTGSSYIGNGVNGMYFWGAQAEIKTTATDYYPTTTRLNIPRLDYTNGSCPSILVEPQRTNLVTYSDNVALSLSIQANTTITSNTSISPDGTQNADNVLFGTSSYRLRVTSISALTNYTASLFFKNVDFASSEEFTLNLSDGVFGAITATIKPSNGTATFTRNTSGWSSVSGKIENYGNGWYRVSVSGTSIGGGSGWYEIGCNVSKNVLIFGMQLEAGSYATSYIPTTSASVTRNADVISKTGISSLIGQTEGVIFLDLYASAKNKDASSFASWIIAGESSINFQIYNLGTTLYWYARNAGGVLIDQNANQTLVEGQRYKIAFAYKSGDYALYINGVQKRTSTNANVPAVSQFNLSGEGFGASAVIVKNEYNSVQFYKTRLTNDQLAQLTTI